MPDPVRDYYAEERAARAEAMTARFRSSLDGALLKLKLYAAGISGDGYYVSGPGDAFSYHGGYMSPHTRFQDRTHAEQASVLAECAYWTGYEQAQRDIRKALGIK